MSGKKLIFVMPMAPFTNFVKNFFADVVQKGGFECEFWDVSALVNYNLQMKVVDINFPYKKIDTFRSFIAELKKVDKTNTVFVPQISSGLQTFPVFFVLSLFKCKTVFFGRGYLPSFSGQCGEGQGRVQKALKMLGEGKIKFVFSVILFQLITKLKLMRNFDVTFVSGEYAEKRHRTDSDRVVHVNHFDVDAANAEPSFEGEGGGMVFLDEYLPHHPDWSISGGFTVDAERYYDRTCKFFDRVEKETGKKVVIAAHPKSLYNEESFRGRAIYYHKTSELVKNADAVFTHASTAVSFAVIYSKPVYLLSSEEIERGHPSIANIMRQTAKMLGCKILDYENESLSFPQLDVNKQLYHEYYKEYLSAITSKEYSGNIVLRELDALVA